ncbi:MAG: biotin--[acetyl-CoA-carboxylase] ligase [Bacteroidota bacterium]
MQIIKLNATDSTNAYLKHLAASQSLGDFTTVLTKNQQNGRGQMGSQWLSEPGKNLTFSVLRKGDNLSADNPFILNIATTLAIHKTLSDLKVPELTIKWPNDILSGIDKICGILIENVISGNHIKASIIGVGLNVNQTTFPHLTNVSSLKLLLSGDWDLEVLLNKLLYNMRFTFQGLGRKNELWEAYERVLFRKGSPSTFESKNDGRFIGTIQGVSTTGKLVIAIEDGSQRAYAFKEVGFIL